MDLSPGTGYNSAVDELRDTEYPMLRGTRLPRREAQGVTIHHPANLVLRFRLS